MLFHYLNLATNWKVSSKVKQVREYYLLCKQKVFLNILQGNGLLFFFIVDNLSVLF